MQVTKITTPAEPAVPKAHQLSEKQLYDEINYHRAERLSKKMLEKGLISADEYDKLLVEIRKIFVPILAELL
ncbi:MAG: hypothetical protein IJ100_03135 [Lachnospiraceae bacterium]|nr:hypothetical protein [Lachnospiraceae bacterium]